MKNLSIPALLLVGALALTGCTAGTGNASAALKAEPVNAETVADVKPVDLKQEWADEKVSQFLSGQGARSFGAFAGEATGSIESWHSPQ